MARLINCNVCGEEMSSAADFCNNCNHPHGKDRKERSKIRVMIFGMIALLIFVFLMKTGLLAELLEPLLAGFLGK